MSWVSQANIKTIMTAIRNKFTTGDLVIANDAKDTGVELNYTAQDGLVTVSPISTDASVESALHLSNGDDTKKTELTQGTLSYVTGTGDSEAYNYMSLLGDGVTFGKKGGGNVQVGGVADPTSAQQVATKNYVDARALSHISISRYFTTSARVTRGATAPAGHVPSNDDTIQFSSSFFDEAKSITVMKGSSNGFGNTDTYNGRIITGVNIGNYSTFVGYMQFSYTYNSVTYYVDGFGIMYQLSGAPLVYIPNLTKSIATLPSGTKATITVTMVGLIY